MNERVVKPAPHLTAIVTLPERVDPSRPAVLLPNTGVEHRVGPNRLHVSLARALAQAGFVTLRLDLAGIGDSDPPAGGTVDSAADLGAAMDALMAEKLASRFALVGLCSGAHDAHQAARRDPRVCAAALLDGYTYPTPRYRLHFIAQRALSPQRWRNRLLRSQQAQRKRELGSASFYERPSRSEVARDYADFAARGLALLLAYTGEWQNVYNYREQHLDAFPQLRRYRDLTLHYLPHCDHTFSRIAQRQQLAELLVAWLARHYGARPSASSQLPS